MDITGSITVFLRAMGMPSCKKRAGNMKNLIISKD
jgi:hypothetical protein